MCTPQCSTLKSKLVPEEIITCVSMVLSLEYLACWEACLTIRLSCQSSTAGQLSVQSPGCSSILCWHFHEKFRNFGGGLDGLQDIALLSECHPHQLIKVPLFPAHPGPNYLILSGAQYNFWGVGSASGLTIFASRLTDGRRAQAPAWLLRVRFIFLRLPSAATLKTLPGILHSNLTWCTVQLPSNPCALSGICEQLFLILPRSSEQSKIRDGSHFFPS